MYALPYMRTWHPMYAKDGGVPAIEEVRFSITHNRGCFGGCNFCALAFHQGRTVRSRSIESVVREAKLREMEEHMTAVVRICRSCGVSEAEAAALLQQFFEEEDV